MLTKFKHLYSNGLSFTPENRERNDGFVGNKHSQAKALLVDIKRDWPHVLYIDTCCRNKIQFELAVTNIIEIIKPFSFN